MSSKPGTQSAELPCSDQMAFCTSAVFARLARSTAPPAPRSEAALLAVPPRRCLLADMAPEEVEAVRRGLLSLRQNVVLLRDPEDPNAFYPVSCIPCRAAGGKQVLLCLRDEPSASAHPPFKVASGPAALCAVRHHSRPTLVPQPDHPLPSRSAPQRFALSTTSSFKALEPHWKDELARLHNDYYYHRQVNSSLAVVVGVGLPAKPGS